MQPKLQQWMYSHETFAGVELLQKQGGYCYNLCLLKKEKDSAKILLQETGIPSLEQLKELIGANTPMFLGINSKGMLLKVLDHHPTSKIEALRAVFPSAQEEEFHLQQVESSTNSLLAVVRKDRVEPLVEEMQTAGLWVVNVFIGPFWMEEILPLLPSSVQELQVGQQLLLIEQQHIIGSSKGEKAALGSFQVGEETVEEAGLLALSMAFLAITQPTIQGLDMPIVQQQQKDFYYKKLFHYTGIAALSLFFMALLGNYLLFEHYHTQQQNLSIEVGQQKSLLEQRAQLAKKYEDKKALLGDQLHLGQSKSSYYADQLAATLPSTLQLTKLVLFPKIQTEDSYNSEEQLPYYDNKTILVTGQCQASVFYNNWKRALEELDWVASIHNLSYQNNKEGQGVFELKITLKQEE